MRFYNTLKKEKEDFVSLEKGKVGLYTCGPTVYDYAHIGNFRAYFFADTLRRTLETAGYEVRHIKNITDVGHMTADDIAQGDSGEDKMVKKAKAEKKSPEEIAAFFEERFHEDETAMNILRAHFFPRATAHIPQMIRMIEALIVNGHAYESNGNVFFDVTSFDRYGALSGNTLKKLKVGARLEEHPDKRNPWDFALWLAAPAGHLMHWPSPWSEGYPGWHIECSAMSGEYLGDTFDIHTGGEDNIFPHHEAEIAQSECVHKKPFVKYWLHTRHIFVDGEKMSKSKGNFYRLADILDRGYSPMDLRMVYLGAHYRSPMTFSWDVLDQAKKNREFLLNTVERLSLAEYTEDADYSGDDFREKFVAAIEDDLNTPLALSVAQEYARSVNQAIDAGKTLSSNVKTDFELFLFKYFGLQAEEVLVPDDVQTLVETREAARLEKNFAESDRLRDLIREKGFEVEDTSSGQRIKKAS